MEAGTMTAADIYLNMSKGDNRSMTTLETTNPVVSKTPKAKVQEEIVKPNGGAVVNNMPLIGLLFIVGLLIGAKFIFEKAGS